jgi:hypothetical protein
MVQVVITVNILKLIPYIYTRPQNMRLTLKQLTFSPQSACVLYGPQNTAIISLYIIN